MAIITVGPNQPAPYRTDGTADQVEVQAAVNAASSGDVVRLENYSLSGRSDYDFSSNVSGKLGVAVRGEMANDDLPAIRINAQGMGGGYMFSHSGGINLVTLEQLWLNGNVTTGKNPGVGAFSFVNSITQTLRDLYLTDFDGSTGFFGGVAGALLERVKTRCTALAAGISHGIDIDTGTGNSSDIVFDGCDLENGTRDAFKAESATGVIFKNGILRSAAVIGDNVTTADAGITIEDSLIDAIVAILLRTATASPTVRRNKFTEAGGTIQIFSDAGAIAVIDQNHFYGRNAYYGFNGVTWFTPTNVQGRNFHYRKPNNLGKTMFCNPAGNGHPKYNTPPYTTPNTARNNFENLVEDVNLDENNMNYACVAGEYSAAAYSTVAVQALTGVVVEGYGGEAVFDLGGTSTDFINWGAAGATQGWQKDVRIKNGANGFNGTGITIQGAATVNIRGGGVQDMNGGGGSYGQAIYCSGAGYNVTVEDFDILRCHGQSSGGAIRAQDAGTFRIRGSRIRDCNSVGGAVRILSTVTAYEIEGTEVIRCNGGGGAAGLFLQKAGKVSAMTFKDNVGTDIDSGANAVTAENCILPDYNNWTGTAKTADTCLIGANNPGGSNITGTPIYENAAADDYRLTDASPGRKVGKKWWTSTGRRPIGSDRNPFPDRLIDIGARQRIGK